MGAVTEGRNGKRLWLLASLCDDDDVEVLAVTTGGAGTFSKLYPVEVDTLTPLVDFVAESPWLTVFSVDVEFPIEKVVGQKDGYIRASREWEKTPHLIDPAFIPRNKAKQFCIKTAGSWNGNSRMKQSLLALLSLLIGLHRSYLEHLKWDHSSVVILVDGFDSIT